MAQTKTYRFKKKDDAPLLPIAISNPSPKTYRYQKKDESHHSVLILSILLLLVLVFGAILLFILSQGSPTPPYVPSNITKPVANLTNNTTVAVNCTEPCLYEQALKGDNYAPCLVLLNVTLSQSCFEHFSNTSIDACKLLTDAEKKQSCVTNFAVESKNALLCDLLLTEGQLNCKVRVDSCYSEPEPGLCLAVKTNDSSKCNSDDACLLNYSLTKQDAITCSYISTEVISKACTSVITSSDLCAPFSQDSQRDYCYQLYSIYKDDYNSCMQIQNLESPYALDCYSHFAITQDDLEVCDALSLNQRWKCYRIYAFATGDITGCSEIHTLASSNRFTCAFDFALEYGNPAACNIIEDITSKKVCYQGAIIYNNTNLDWHNCAGVAMADWSNKCYNEAAKLVNDVSICDMIELSSARETCKIAYEVNQSKIN